MAVLRVYDRPSLDRMDFSDVQTLAHRLSPSIKRYGVNRDILSNSIIAYQALNVRGVRRVVGVGLNYVASHPKTSAGAAVVLGAGLAGGLYATDTWPFNETVQTADADKDTNSGLNGKTKDAAPPEGQEADGTKSDAEPKADAQAGTSKADAGADAQAPAPEGEQAGKQYTTEPEWSPFQRELLGVVEATDAEYWDITQRHLKGLSAKGREVQEAFDRAATAKAREVYQDPARKEAYRDNLQKAGEAGVEKGLAPQAPAEKPAEPSKPAEGAPKD